ncbi:alpha/beta fold hydrolase [Kineosporia succinea]|uniref:Pimeloyl-ACP methyl ester carboxylesterase n=1 Tax=Kineosporia succinea TaxID=84632 RepID=A0ABT9PCV8_9ACTN|nr:alpha/beta hydrolase [Kineosporia succinea]MDP9830326.1 pimeloyl-ACP methyl ester carboxylesterase [Kineosporia succinea]
MPSARSNGLDLYYETFGSDHDPALLLVMGMGEQLLGWPEEFCRRLADRGFHVIRFDHRDVGASTWLDDLGDVDVKALFTGDTSTVRYTFTDLVADTVGLITALGLSRVHLAGVSMGAGIAQQIAIDHPPLVASLASVSGTTSDPAVRESTISDPSVLLPSPGADRDAAIEAEVVLYRAIGSSAVSDEELLRRAIAKVDRAHHPAGVLRHLAANATATDRTEGLRAVWVPTVVIHGGDDPLLGLRGARATAEATGADLVVVPGMAHDLPEHAWNPIIDAIARNAAAKTAS